MNYLIVLEYITARVIIIKLTDEEKSHIADCRDMQDFVKSLGPKYAFSADDSSWMVSDELNLDEYY